MTTLTVQEELATKEDLIALRRELRSEMKRMIREATDEIKADMTAKIQESEDRMTTRIDRLTEVLTNLVRVTVAPDLIAQVLEHRDRGGS